MRYKIQKYDDKGLPVGGAQSAAETSAAVPRCVRKALALSGVIEVELHFEKGTSRAFSVEVEDA